MTPTAVLLENARREAALDAARDGYDPWTGANSPIPRRSVRLLSDREGTVALPEEMFDDNGEDRDPDGWFLALRRAEETGESVQEVVESTGQAFDEDAFLRHRCRFDFEYWCAARVVIKDKAERVVPFVLNAPQRAAYAERHRLRRTVGLVRYLELKFRQYGSTTADSWEIVWVITEVHRGQSAYMISLQSGGAA
ncbi:MAG TPA: hypothetical protein VF576_05875, partial [Rubricoccaceae bacterium]